MLAPKTKAPEFILPDQDNKIHRLSDYRGRWVFLYFYPKDNTPGCTKEACAVSDSLALFNKIKTQIFGVSADSVISHKKFSEKYNLNFPLLSDAKGDVLKQYKIWGEKKLAGRKYMGIKRASYLIDPSGKIAKAYHKVKPDIHAVEVLNDLNNLI